jgi:Citrate synthase, C-terminal domain
MFTKGSDSAVGAAAFVKQMRQENQLIMGIGHRIKSLSNPDMRVNIIKEYAKAHFRDTAVLDFALSVEQVSFRLPLASPARHTSLQISFETCAQSSIAIAMLKACCTAIRSWYDKHSVKSRCTKVQSRPQSCA